MKLSKEVREILGNWKDDLDKCAAAGQHMNVYAYRARHIYGNFAGDSTDHDIHDYVELDNFVHGIHIEYTTSLSDPDEARNQELLQQYIDEATTVLAATRVAIDELTGL